MTDVVGLRFVAMGEKDALAAIRRFREAQDRLTRGVLDGAAKVQSVSSAWDRANNLYRQGVINADALRAAQTQLGRELATLNNYVRSNGSLNTQKALAELHAAQASREAARATEENNRATQRANEQYRRLRMSIDPVFAAQQRMKQAHDTVRQALARETVTRQQAAQTLRLYRQRMREAGQTTVTTTDFVGRLRTQFLATANTIAILDGPLGGIASRFSAFGVLLGRTGLLLAGLAVSMTALIAVGGRGVRMFSEFEVQAARINAILETTRNQVGLTGREIERMAASIALATLESEQGVRDAAARLLTFRDISGQVFEDVLRAAADMAAMGFGTIESEAIKLAKALEDPAQALTSLSRAGIVFTRQQRAMIISMVEAGDRAGAMERILANVNARVGGAGEAAARDTFAGALDTIGQAAGRAVRELGQFIVEVTGLGRAVSAVADLVADFAAGPITDEQRLAELRAERAALDNLVVVHDALSTAMLHRGQRTAEHHAREAARLDAAIRDVETRIQQEKALAALQQQEGAVSRRREGIDNLLAEIEMRERLIGLTEEQQRAQRAFAAEGLLMEQADIDAAIDRYRDSLAAVGASWNEIRVRVARHRDELQGLQSLFDRYLRSLQEARAVQEATRAAESQQDRIARMGLEIGYLRQGYELAEARRRTEDDLALVMYESVLAAGKLPPETRKALEEAVRLLEVARAMEDTINDITDAQRELNAMQERYDNLLAEQEVLEEQLRLLESGIEYSVAMRLAEINVAKARVETLMITEGVTDELTKQLALLNAMADTVVTVVDLEDRVRAFRPRGGGGGGRGREPTDIQTTIDQMDERIRREEHLITLTEQQRAVMEVFYTLKDANDKADIRMTEERLMRYAEEFAARERLIEQKQREQQMAERLGQTLGNLFMAATEGANSFRRALAGVLRSLAQMLANGAFTALMRRSTGLMGALTGLSGVLLNANGNAFMGGNVIPFADGGVVSRPTMFPMSGNRTGLMGEAGPEAIMPLKRGRDGKLGVAAPPQEVAVDVRVHMDENGNWQANVEKIADRRVRAQAPGIVRQSVQATYAANSERRMA